ncbi:MAG: hypothetical protein LQ339_008750 [Xanthoria mediterranea]|nr:MAG: hypothetical protein LQ339_008750 [Xanthoria mediterranea]
MSFNIAPLEVGKARKLSQGRKLSYISEHGVDFQPYSDPAGVPGAVPDFLWKPSPRMYLVFLTLAVITMMVALDGTSLSVALPIISEKLGGQAIEAFWSGTSFLLCSTIFQPSFASFSHIFGRKPMILTGLVFFLIGSIIAAVARDFAVLLAGRSLQGIGGGGLIALTEIVVADLVPLRLRGQWFGLISAMWALGSVTGPIIGGAFAQAANWRWIFWINLPFIGVAFVFIPLFLKLAFKPSSLTAQLARVDWFGSFLFIASTTAFLIPITWGGVSYAWTSWHTLVPLCLGIAGLITFIAYEETVAAEPLIRLVIFKNQTAAVSYSATVIHGMILWSLLYYLPLYYEAVKGFSPIVSGVALFPETFTVAPASVAVGILITVTGRYRWAIWGGWVLTVLGTGLLYLLDVDTSTAAWIFINLVGGLGMGMLFPSMAFAIQASQTNEDLAFAIAMFSFFRAFGQTLGVAVGGTVFQNQMKSKLLAYPALASKAGEYSKDASGLVQIIKSMQDDAMKQNLQHAYADSLKVVWATMCGLGAAGLILSLGTKGLDMNKPLETEQYFLDERNTADEEKK